MSIKAKLKSALQSQPALWNAYWSAKQQVRRLFLLRYFLRDIGQTYRAMFWPTDNSAKTKLSSELLFQYHKIEKGLVMPGAHRLFGVEPAQAAIKLCRRWVKLGYPQRDPVFLGALETLRSYHQRLLAEALDPHRQILPPLERLFTDFQQRTPELATPVPLNSLLNEGYNEQSQGFQRLAIARRSVRNFKPDPVPMELIESAARSAQLSPSACNRQPCRVYIVSDAARRKELLSFQNGNRGFGHTVPHVAILTADEDCFFDASERHEPYIDGGLFAMSFILALRDLGVGSCCLNWCVPPKNDVEVHRRFAIPDSQRIIMLLAIGYDADEIQVPRSPRRLDTDVLISVS